MKSRLDRKAFLLLPDSPFDYEQMSPSKFTGGYYMGAPWRDIIVVRELLNARQTLFHEYTHLVLHHQGGRWPVWFNEGTAEFFSSMRRTGYGIEAGAEELRSLAAIDKSGRSQYLLGTGLFFQGDFEGAVRAFEKTSGLPQPDEFRAARLKALSLSRLSRFDEAREAAEKLKTLAADADQRQSAQLTIEDVRRERQQTETPPEPLHKAVLKGLTGLEGDVVRIDCLGQRARFWVRSGAETKKLLLVDPHDVVSGDASGAPLEFGCGMQRRTVIIGYRPQRDPATIPSDASATSNSGELSAPGITVCRPGGVLLVDNGSMNEREAMRRWVQTWKEAGPELESIRRREIREADNLKVLATLEGAFNHALRTMPARASSGMVDMQEWLAKLRR